MFQHWPNLLSSVVYCKFNNFNHSYFSMALNCILWAIFSPLSQFDLPSSLPDPPLSFPVSTVSTSSSKLSIPQTPSRPMLSSPMPTPLEMSESMARANPTLDYTPPELVSLIISDLGVMSPSVCHLPGLSCPPGHYQYIV